MSPSFCSLTDTKRSLQYTIKTHLCGPPMPKFETNMNYTPPSPPSSTKQCNKSATVKFHMELLLTTTTRKQSRSVAIPNTRRSIRGGKQSTMIPTLHHEASKYRFHVAGVKGTRQIHVLVYRLGRFPYFTRLFKVDFIEEIQLVIFYMKNISRVCVARR